MNNTNNMNDNSNNSDDNNKLIKVTQSINDTTYRIYYFPTLLNFASLTVYYYTIITSYHIPYYIIGHNSDSF